MAAVVLPGLAAFSGCPPNAGTPGEMPGIDGDSKVRTGAWMFAFYSAATDNLFSGSIFTAGVQLDADGSTRTYFYDSQSLGTSSWSQVDDNFELVHELGVSTITGKVVNSQYIEGYLQENDTGAKWFFAAHFLTPDPSQLPDPGQLEDFVVGNRDGSWHMTYFDHVSDEEFITVAGSGGTNVNDVKLGIDPDGLIYAIGADSDNGPSSASWSQNGKAFRISESLGAAGDSSWEGQFITSSFIVGTFIHANGGASTFILRWKTELGPIVSPGPIGPVGAN